jgi:hypothetical protein
MILEIRITINIITIIANEKLLMLAILVMLFSKSNNGNAEIIINTIATNSSAYSLFIDIMLSAISHHSRLH